MAESKKSSAQPADPHPAQVQLHLASAGCPEFAAQKFATAGVSWSQLQQIIAFVQAHGAQLQNIWSLVAELWAIFQGTQAEAQSPAGPGIGPA